MPNWWALVCLLRGHQFEVRLEHQGHGQASVAAECDRCGHVVAEVESSRNEVRGYR